MQLHPLETNRSCLERDEVHLWWGRDDAVESLDDLRAWLSDEERGRGERFRLERDARAFLFRRAFRRSILAAYTGRAPAALAFASGANGKPSLVGVAELAFNASSSGPWVLLGVARARALGVDVERIDARLAEAEGLSLLARRVLGPTEQLELAGYGHDQRLAAFLRAWTRKEAFLKATGTGLAREPDTLALGLAPCAQERPLSEELSPGRAARNLDLAAPPGFAASLVVEARPGESLRYLCYLRQADPLTAGRERSGETERLFQA